MDLKLIASLQQPADTKVVLLVMDGLGGLPIQTGGPTELEAANTPNLDALAALSMCGLHQPVAPGVTPGSGPAHLALFGYDPLTYQVQRGVLEALGVDFPLQRQDVAARGNFCTMDDEGRLTDRRAGRIPTEVGAKLCDLLGEIELPGVELFVRPVKDYRFLFVLRGPGLSDAVSETDPQMTGVPALEPQALKPEAAKTAELVQLFLEKAQAVLKDHHPANAMVLRGFAQTPDWPTFTEVYGMRAAAIALYPMYRGVAKLVGMEVLDVHGDLEDEFALLEQSWADYDFFFVHIKPTDSSGEDGAFDRKVGIIEQVDALLPRLLALDPDVVVVTGDHSTPAALKSHSWHPVPAMLYAKTGRRDSVTRFGETACLSGGLGPHLPGCELLPLALAHAQRMKKFGA
ncbi:MAG: 2,3-bisphosphoglycerate-independent phosphoglycerate mutase [Anaerolineae bacterium]|jgi:2,3-bisphosphoglycerate-independent phosphoglycerate mutase